MALVTTEIALVETYQPYQGMSDQRRLVSGVPRGMRVFNIFEAAVAAKPLNDTQTLIATTDLISRNFAYVLAHIYMQLNQDTAFDWNNRGQLRVRNAVPAHGGFGSTLQKYALALEDVTDPTDHAESWIMRPLSLLQQGAPSQPIWNTTLPPTTEMHVSMQFTNSTAAASAAGIMSAGIWLWEYDLAQAQMWPINYASPVQIR